MTLHRAPILLIACSLNLLLGAPAWAQHVYRWVDADGVVNFSDTAPPAADEAVDTLRLEDTTPKAYDPEQDLYNVAAQAERMQALREEMERQREQRRERLRNAPAQSPEQQPEGVRYGYPYGYPAYGRPPARPPNRPRPPRPEPYETSTLRSPGQLRDPDGP